MVLGAISNPFYEVLREERMISLGWLKIVRQDACRKDWKGGQPVHVRKHWSSLRGLQSYSLRLKKSSGCILKFKMLLYIFVQSLVSYSTFTHMVLVVHLLVRICICIYACIYNIYFYIYIYINTYHIHTQNDVSHWLPKFHQISAHPKSRSHKVAFME